MQLTTEVYLNVFGLKKKKSNQKNAIILHILFCLKTTCMQHGHIITQFLLPYSFKDLVINHKPIRKKKKKIKSFKYCTGNIHCPGTAVPVHFAVHGCKTKFTVCS